MSLVLNGGVSGSATTQAAYVDAKIVSALPISVCAWFRTSTGTGSGATRNLFQLCDKDQTAGTYTFHGQARIASGPILSVQSNIVYTTGTSVTPTATETFSVTAIAEGATTILTAVGHNIAAGMRVRITGATGLTPDLSGKDYEVTATDSDTVTLNVATSGTYTGTSTVSRSQIQPSVWTLAVMSFHNTSQKRRLWVGLENGSLHASGYSTSPSSGTDIDSAFAECDRWNFGAMLQASNANWLNGELAHAAIWNNKQLNDTEAAELLSTTPDAVSWGTPAAYWPLLSDATDSIGSNDLTLVGSPSITSAGPGIVASGVTGYFPAFTPNRGLIFGAG